MNTKIQTLDGFYKATNVYLNAVEFTGQHDWNNYDETYPTGCISIFTSNRVADLKEANNNVTANIKDNEIWLIMTILVNGCIKIIKFIMNTRY